MCSDQFHGWLHCDSMSVNTPAQPQCWSTAAVAENHAPADFYRYYTIAHLKHAGSCWLFHISCVLTPFIRLPCFKIPLENCLFFLVLFFFLIFLFSGLPLCPPLQFNIIHPSEDIRYDVLGIESSWQRLAAGGRESRASNRIKTCDLKEDNV